MSETTANDTRAAAATSAGNRLSRTGPAKFLRPRTPAGAIARTRLFQVLDANVAAPLTLIVGPPGYGKSTLASQWLAESRTPHAWLFADEHDADPAVFMRSLIAAVARTDPALVPRSAALLDNERAPFPQLLAELLDELSRVAPPFVIVIDDYQRAQSHEIDSLLGMLLRSLGSTPSLLVITRTRPQLPLDVLSAYGEVAVLDVAELRFSNEEARALMRQSGSSDLNNDQLDQVVDRAAGWVVGLRLLSSTADAIGALTRPPGAGSRPAIGPELAGYLFSEVIDQQPAGVQDFLLRTAILEYLRPDFCNALTGRSDSQALLDRFVDDDLFTQLVDRDNRSYRYHPLFRDALLSRQGHSLSTESIEMLHRTAALRYQAIDSFEWAAHHHILAGDWEVALELVHRQAVTWMLDDHLSSLDVWTSHFPLDVLLRDSFLTFCRLWALTRLGRVTDAERLVELARRRGETGDDPYFDLRLDLITAYAALLRSDYETCLRYCRTWLDAFPWPGTFEHLAFMIFECLSYCFAGQPLVASASLDRTRALIESTGRSWIDSLESNLRGRILNMRGQNTKAKAVFKQAVSLGERSNAQPLHYAHLLLAQANLESMELRSARSNAVRCLELAETIGTAVHSSPALQVLADVATVRGDRHEAEQHIRQAIEIAQRHDLTGQRIDAEARRAHYLIASGDAEGAASWAESLLAQGRAPKDYRHYRENAVLARYLIATERYTEADALIGPLFEEARGSSRRRDEFEMAVLSAESRWCAGNEIGAISIFRPALRRAQEHQWIFILMQDIHILAPMLQRLSDDPEIGAFVDNLLRERRDRLHLRVVLDSTGSPLTPRERDMLSGLLTGKSNRELADEMFISEYTVKRHLSNLYTKLGVSSRAQAIAFFANRGER